MKKFNLLLVVFFIIPTQVHAFSDGFKQHMTSVQNRVLLKQEKFSQEDAQKVWDKYDEEVLNLLSKEENSSEEALNKETAKTQFEVVERKKTEIEPITLGSASIQFFNLRSPKSPLWLAVYTNDFESFCSSTLHFFEKVDGSYKKVASLEDSKGPWETDQVLKAVIQIQKMSGGKFSSYHQAKGNKNRSQILWEGVKPVMWFPEVDFHMSGETKIAGRGPGYPIQ